MGYEQQPFGDEDDFFCLVGQMAAMITAGMWLEVSDENLPAAFPQVVQKGIDLLGI